MAENKQLILEDGSIADSKLAVKKAKKDDCCGFCPLNGKGPATENGQNENKEGTQILAEIME